MFLLGVLLGMLARSVSSIAACAQTFDAQPLPLQRPVLLYSGG